ncbi:hypothetical protein QAD02_007861 [Eretmocerus hayati]|uniref:Uncharacterized protein n=1 Tax=Eretmocerus hayati TaxID=131215 RepID=A0ACC2N796_9HYME|nr:hypothetical protein QAD02_007861 [Eretmocerus hayati]
MSPYKSSPFNFWPILGLIFHQFATYKPSVIGAYYGKGKPFSVDLYLDDVIAELNHLCKEGIVIKGKHFEIQIKCFCCDKPARSFLECVVNHGAYYACERYWVTGFYYLGRVVYPLRECQQRTDESFRNRENPEHHDGTLLSPLLKLRDKNDKPLDLTKLFIQEFMHAGPLGIMKKLMTENWFSDDDHLTREMKIRVSLRLANIAHQVPSEFERTTRELNILHYWKAKEYRLMLTQIGPFVLEGVLSKD